MRARGLLPANVPASRRNFNNGWRSQSFWSMTSVDLITTLTSSPFFNFISSALRRVITLSMRCLPNADMRHDVSELDFFDDSRKLVPCGKWHDLRPDHQF
jgi:hypothetical protein